MLSDCYEKESWPQVFRVVKKSEPAKEKSGREPKKEESSTTKCAYKAPGKHVNNAGFLASLSLLLELVFMESLFTRTAQN